MLLMRSRGAFARRKGAVFYAKTDPPGSPAFPAGPGALAAPARAFLAFHFASFFARLAAPARSFFPLFLLRRVSSIWE